MVEIAPLSEPMKANGREPVTIARAAPIVPPWVKHTTRSTSVAFRDPPDRRTDTRSDGFIGLGAGNDIPAFLLEHLKGEGITLGDALAVDAAVPLAQTNLGQCWFDLGHEPEPRSEWSPCLGGSAQTCHVDGVDASSRQAIGDEHRLFPAELRQSRIAPAVDEREWSIRIGGR